MTVMSLHNPELLFLAEACQRVFDPTLLSCAKKRRVEPPGRSCLGVAARLAQLNKRAAALLKSSEFSIRSANKIRECLQLRRHSLAVMRLRWFLIRLQRSCCRAANVESLAVTRHFCSAKVLVRGRWCVKMPSPRGRQGRENRTGKVSGAVKFRKARRVPSARR